MTDIDVWNRKRSEQAKPLFIARRATWQRVLYGALGWPCLAIGLIAALVAASSGQPGGGGDALLQAGIFGGLGGSFLLIGKGLRTQVEAHDDHLVVRGGLAPRRTVLATDIARLDRDIVSSKKRSWATITGRDERRKRLFQVIQGYPGSADLAAWLQARRPEQWAAFPGRDEQW